MVRELALAVQANGYPCSSPSRAAAQDIGDGVASASSFVIDCGLRLTPYFIVDREDDGWKVKRGVPPSFGFQLLYDTRAHGTRSWSATDEGN